MNRARTNRAGKILIIFVLTVMLVLGTVTAAYAETIRDTDVTVAGSGNTLVYLEGEFKYVSKDTILKRINEIRYEAWAEGLVSTYIPIQWSSDLEWIAQTRAAEASMYAAHYRPTYKSYNTCRHGGNYSVVEVLYWSGTTSMMDAIQGWYNEKGTGDTSHYIELINPANRYIGLGAFKPNGGTFGAVAGEFSEKTSMTTTQDGTYGACKQKIEVDNSSLDSSYITMADSWIYNGETTTASLRAETYFSGVFTFRLGVSLASVNWSSSDTSVATVDSTGKITGVKAGTATITAKSGGVSFSKTITVKAKNGWFKEGSYYYWYKNGVKAKNKWVNDGKGWCYVDSNGRMLSSRWLEYKKDWYYLKDSGYMAQSQWLNDGKAYYYFEDDGKMASSKWIKSGNSWYYVRDNGRMAVSQWINDGNGVYWIESDGKMAKSKWIKYGDAWYYVKASGKRASLEWINDGKGWFWIESDGKMARSKWLDYNGARYYLKSNGYMAQNEWAKDRDGWRWLGDNGKVVKGDWVKYEGKWYYQKINGYMATEWRIINGKCYYFHPTSGYMYAGGTYTINGNEYTFAANGVLQGDVPEDAMNMPCDWDDGVVTTEPTCTTNGVKTYTCMICGKTRTESIPALGHDWGPWTVTKKPTCVDKGTETRTCKNDANHFQTRDIDPTGQHTWDDGVVTKEATYDEAGVLTYTCSVCKQTRTEEIPKLIRNGWFKEDGKWYYYKDDTMLTGWQEINGKKYYLKPNGVMASNEWVKGFWWINKDGTWTYPYKASWKQSGDRWWFGDTNGWYAKNETLIINDKSYTFDAKGWLVE